MGFWDKLFNTGSKVAALLQDQAAKNHKNLEFKANQIKKEQEAARKT